MNLVLGDKSLDALLTPLQSPNLADSISLIVFLVIAVAYLSKGRLWLKQDPYYHLFFEKPQLSQGSSTQRKARSRNIAQRLEELSKQVVIFWGSQSGTAEGFAKRLAHDLEAKLEGVNAWTADLSDYDPDSIRALPKGKIAIFLLSTFGEGDPSDNAGVFWKWVRATEAGALDVRYCVFGLGNSGYKYFNQVAKISDEMLHQRGANRLFPLRLADDASGSTEEDFITWKDDLIQFFEHDLGYQTNDLVYTPSIEISWDATAAVSESLVESLETSQPKTQGMTSTQLIPLQASRELFSDSAGRNCIHMELDLTKTPQVVYKTGDHLAIWPANPENEVDVLLQLLGLEDKADMPVRLKPLNEGRISSQPAATTIRSLFRHQLAITAPVSREALGNLALFAPSSESEAFLMALAKSKEEYASFRRRHAAHLGRILELASTPSTTWTRLPLTLVLETLDALKPRRYSISSSSLVTPRALSITAVVDATTLPESNERVFGLATNYLLDRQCSAQGLLHPHKLTYYNRQPMLLAQVHRTRFKLPTLASAPLLLIASGTGIAPFHAFLQERARLKQLGRPVGKMILFYGCRRADEDHLYAEELAAMQRILNEGAAAPLCQIITAYSRPDALAEKRYVQDRVREYAAEVAQMLVEDKAGMFLCGMSAMARGVAEAVEGVLVQQKGWTEKEARSWCEERKRGRKWLEDVWG